MNRDPRSPDKPTARPAGRQTAPQAQAAGRERRSADKLRALINTILSSNSITRTLFELIDEFKELFEADKVTVFAIDRPKRQLFSRNFKDNQVEEIRVDISPKSLAGFVAASGRTLNVLNAYDNNELKRIHPELTLDKSFDERLGYKTKTVLVVALPHNRKMMGVLQIINKNTKPNFSDQDVRLAKELASTLGHAIVKMQTEIIDEKIQATSHAIHSAGTLDEILMELKVPILQLFDCRLAIIYAGDPAKKELYSKLAAGSGEGELRLPMAADNLPGCVAMEKRILNVKNVHDQVELVEYHPDLVYEKTIENALGEKAKSMLVAPLVYEGKVMGVLQLANKQNEIAFTQQDERSIKTIADSLALAIKNKQKQKLAKPTKFSYLINNGIITQDELTKAISKARTSGVDIETILLDQYNIKRSDFGKSLEEFYSVPYFGYSSDIVLPQSLFTGLNTNFLLKNNWLPIAKDEEQNKVTILIDNPANQDKAQSIKLIFPKRTLDFKVGLRADIHDFLNATPEDDSPGSAPADTGDVDTLLSALQSEKDDVEVEASSDEEEANAISETDSTIVKLVNKVLIDAYDNGVSDIHIEPGLGKKAMRIRFRKDGGCRVYQEIPPMYRQAFLSRIKIMSKLDIAERRLPQSGKIKMKYGKKDIEYRVETCPTVGGNEDAVLRILAASKPIPLENMNFSQRNLELIRAMASKPYGLILCVGPTGSGKTTTLHSTLGFINTPEKKIWTAEDPVEITQDGLRQVQMLNKIGLDFARAMRSFLRGDPDVIMVGEMRDVETCAVGLEASLTGHLVFSTLHTNSAPETITRLLDMGMNPLNFADALLLIVAQRLVRTLCKACKKEYHPSKEEYDILLKEYGDPEMFAKNVNIPYSDDLMLQGPGGCDKCSNTGYAGRTGLHECLEGTEDIKRMVMKQALVEEIRKQAAKDGMTTLKQDGIWKVFKGDCDLKQVLAVCIQ
ncbi:ATPase, T2SS/T4P/T4SS family [Nitrospina watsonii]|uniref:ATPase, T2SS/T4P/T4SS family n=1 Tax=Nitrospina watsonii TaxID=1323948 RepID=UPI002492F0FE|nr:ATPase, T2SS/T4P/T4SS family [Nitrospina watsonii]